MEYCTRVRASLLTVLLFSSIGALGQCTSGDCQQGAIAGPYTTPQTAEYTATNFPVCVSSTCTTGHWRTGVNGISAQQNIGTEYQFYDKASNFDDNIAVGPTVQGKNAQVLEWVDFGSVQAFDKVTGQPIFTFNGGTTAVPQSVLTLWSASTQPECANGASGNVPVIYDRLDNEFVISRHVSYLVSGVITLRLVHRGEFGFRPFEREHVLVRLRIWNGQRPPVPAHFCQLHHRHYVLLRAGLAAHWDLVRRVLYHLRPDRSERLLSSHRLRGLPVGSRGHRSGQAVESHDVQYLHGSWRAGAEPDSLRRCGGHR